MAQAPLPPNEAKRVEALQRLGLLDTPPEERFDRLTRLAHRLFGVPTALLSLVDSDRQWFKSRIGLDLEEIPRESSFCAHAIEHDGIMIVGDALEHEIFKDNPMVKGEPFIRFYAGRPVKAPDGTALGTLCIIDHEPRGLSDGDQSLLNDLADMVEHEFRAIELATMDDLTGLSNRRGFWTIARHTLALCRRVSRPATLLLFDLNDFKQINDTLGHMVGDRVLQDFGRELLSTFRDSDVVARLGGDEFCVLLSGATEKEARRPVNDLERKLAKHPHLSYSVGFAEYDPNRHEAAEDLVEEADARMYEHKRSRR